MSNLTGYHEKLCEISSEIVSHGWGEFRGVAETLKDNVVKIEICCGKKYVFFIKKSYSFDRDNII